MLTRCLYASIMALAVRLASSEWWEILGMAIVFGKLFAVRKTILKVQPNGVFDIFDGLFVCVALAVTALKRRAGNEVAV